MDHSTVDLENDEPDTKESLLCLYEDAEATIDKGLHKVFFRKPEKQHISVSKLRKSHSSLGCTQESFFQRIRSFDLSIPMQVLSVDEKYLCYCLEMIYSFGLKGASYDSPLHGGILTESLSSIKMSFEFAPSVARCSFAAGPAYVAVNSADNWILGTLNRNVSNTLSSSLFRQAGDLNSEIKSRRTSSISSREPTCVDYVSSPGRLSINSSHMLKKEIAPHGNHKNESKPSQRRLLSISSTSSTFSFQSSSTTTTGYQGMLQCTWKNGFPHYVFSLDDQREMFVATLNKVDSSGHKGFAYMYAFHSNTGGHKALEKGQGGSTLVGKMKVSSSLSLSPRSGEITETQFVMFGFNDNCLSEVQASRSSQNRKKGLLPKKFVNASRSHSIKHRTCAKFRATNAIHENPSGKISQDPSDNLDPLNIDDLSENYLSPHLELAAIIVKDHVHETHEELESGGWGLKFLKKVGIRKNKSYLENATLPNCCVDNTGDCNRSVEVLVPAGSHGGPRARNGGPSSLIERWRSGGHCDCGGWDIGCPLTVLNNGHSGNEHFSEVDSTEKCESFDLFMQGSKQDVPTIRMVNIHQGLYHIHFQSSLSSLQSFAIAVAVIHTRTPNFLQKFCRS